MVMKIAMRSLLTMIYLSWLLMPSGVQAGHLNGDVNGDGRITPEDALCVFRRFLGLASCLDHATNRETSYNNFKAVGLIPQDLPLFAPARAYADFSGNGHLDLFAAVIMYNPSKPISEAIPSRFEFWFKQSDGTFIKDTSLLPSSDGCIHPRKVIVADFNGDNRPDIFVACHGYDVPPFPGERNKVVLSQVSGTYVVQDASSDVRFFHGAAAADMNDDGHVDVLVINHPISPAFLLLNDGSGNFVRSSLFALPSSLNHFSYFTLELVDVNEDGKIDLLLGGHEFENAATVLLTNPGDDNFSEVIPITLPPVPGEGVVLDFTVTGSGSHRTL